MKTEEKVRQYIASQRLLTASGLHIVALSGGADSVALLLIMLRLGYRVAAAHCNFQLRGSESGRDEQFVAGLCERLNVPLHLAHFDTKTYAELHRLSIEMAARQLRYHYFAQLRRDIGAEAVCVAHQADDAVETLLMNLMNGAGIHGLTGIRPRNGHIVRPLLCLTRQEVTDFLQSAGQDYVTDSTNLSPDTTLRNQIRLRLLPLMNTVLPGTSRNILRTATFVAEAERVYNAAVSTTADKVSRREGDILTIDTHALSTAPSPESILFELLTPLGFNSAQVADICRHLAANQPGRLFLSSTHELATANGQLVVSPCTPAFSPMSLPEPGTYRLCDGRRLRIALSADVAISRQPNVATLDAANIRFPLTIRRAAEGDRMHPYGLKGSKLVSDMMTDQRLTLLDKRRQLVVTDASGQILWLVSRRTSHQFRITSKTIQTLTISLEEE
ncbi:MAG: tRNA lysidine(34) synthetase TilS [Prevotella sp.]|nr:tRNA lysidine(34) synthetase TilS [Prevotella sp.]